MSEALKPGDKAPPFRLQPVFGLPLELPGTPSLLLFLRPVGSVHTRSMLSAMQEAHREFDGIQVVQFTRSALEPARDFVPRQHLLLPLVCDPAGEWYRQYGVRESFFSGIRGIWGLPEKLSKGRGAIEAPYGQNAAAFLVSAEGTIRWTWYGRGIFDLPKVSSLLEALRA